MIKEKHKVAGNFYYNPDDILGSGAWGTVYKAYHVNENVKKLYALKKINKFKIEASEASLQNFKNEIKTLQKAHYIPQVIYFMDFFKSKSSYYIITQYEPGSINLFEYMSFYPSKFTESEARPIMIQLLQGIKALHTMHIVHRDLKVKIIDFGLATNFDSSEGRVGSPLFMSPQVLKEEKYTFKCDIWSLGIVFYWMICHSSPYGDNPSVNHIMDVMTDLDTLDKLPIPKTSYVSKKCEQVIKACLKWDEEDRMDIEDILKLKFFQEPNLAKFKHCLDFYEPEFSFLN